MLYTSPPSKGYDSSELPAPGAPVPGIAILRSFEGEVKMFNLNRVFSALKRMAVAKPRLQRRLAINRHVLRRDIKTISRIIYDTSRAEFENWTQAVCALPQATADNTDKLTTKGGTQHNRNCKL